MPPIFMQKTEPYDSFWPECWSTGIPGALLHCARKHLPPPVLLICCFVFARNISQNRIDENCKLGNMRIYCMFYQLQLTQRRVRINNVLFWGVLNYVLTLPELAKHAYSISSIILYLSCSITKKSVQICSEFIKKFVLSR